MMNPTKVLGIAAPTLVGVGIVTAVLLGGGQDVRTVTLPSGTELVAVLDQAISTDQSSIGDAVQLRTDELVAAGALVRGTVTHVKGGGRIAGAPELAVLFTDLEVDGHRYPISVELFRVKGQSEPQLTLAAGQRLRLRLMQPVTIEYRPRAEKAAP